MPPKERSHFPRVHPNIKDFFGITKLRPAASRKPGRASSTPIDPESVSSTGAISLPDRTSSKRKALTSGPSSPASARPERKRRVPALFSPKPIQREVAVSASTALGLHLPTPTSSKPLLLIPEDVKEHSAIPTVLHQISDEADIDIEEDLGSNSDRNPSPCSSCSKASSLAPHRPAAWAVRARARDEADANRVLKTIREVKNGTYSVKKGGPGGKYLVQRVLHHSGYKLLRDVKLREEGNGDLRAYLEDACRFDYIRHPCKGDKQFVLHMPSAFHESMAGMFSDEIRNWLYEIKKGALCTIESTKKNTKEVASKINSTLATRVKCNEPRDDQLEPDLSFTYKECAFADLVVEVAWSQRALKLPDRARRYIKGKKGRIRTVVSLNMNDIYQGGFKATFSIWKAHFDIDTWTHSTVEFINENRQAVEDCVLPLSLKDFVCDKWERRIKEFEDIPLKIPSTKLYSLYETAFMTHVMGEAEDEMEKVSTKADSGLEKLQDLEEVLPKQRIKELGGEIGIGKNQFATIKETMFEVDSCIEEMKKTIQNVQKNMSKVGDQMLELEEMKTEFEEKMIEVLTKANKMRAKIENLVEVEEASEPEQGTSGEDIIEGSERDGADGQGAPQTQPASPQISERRSKRSRVRSLFSIKH